MLVVSLNYNNNYLLFKICCETIVVVIFYFLMVHLLKFQKITFDLVQELVSILLYIYGRITAIPDGSKFPLWYNASNEHKTEITCY